MKRLDLVLNGKGGVGKTFFLVNFVPFLKDQAIARVAIDNDRECFGLGLVCKWKF